MLKYYSFLSNVINVLELIFLGLRIPNLGYLVFLSGLKWELIIHFPNAAFNFICRRISKTKHLQHVPWRLVFSTGLLSLI